jgi:creatinine amidohydrolase
MNCFGALIITRAQGSGITVRSFSFTARTVGTLGTALAVAAGAACGQMKKAAASDRVDLGLMTAYEVRDAIANGKTTALIYNGGTETRGPADVNGGHTLMAQAKVVTIARELGNAIAAPVLPFSPNNANPALPGTIGLTAETFKEVNREVAEQLIRNGFKNVVLMGDHGGGQKELGELATELDAKYAGQGIRVVFCGDTYLKATDDWKVWLISKGYPPGEHATVTDTSEMLYLEPAPNAWVRKDMLPLMVERDKTAPPDPTKPINGVSGDGRRSSAELGKYGVDLMESEAVAQIRQLLSASNGQSIKTGSVGR